MPVDLRESSRRCGRAVPLYFTASNVNVFRNFFARSVWGGRRTGPVQPLLRSARRQGTAPDSPRHGQTVSRGVTMIIVFPSRAKSSMTSSTSRTISGSRAAVTSSKSRDLRVHTQCPHNGDALLLAAGKLPRVAFGLLQKAHPVQQGLRPPSVPRP